MKTIKINGEFTKEELQEKLKEFEMWEIKADEARNISIYKGRAYKGDLLFNTGEDTLCNLSTISRDMAEIMKDLMETKDVLDYSKVGYAIFYDISEEKWDIWIQHKFINHKHFKTEETAELASELLNESKAMRDWIKRMSE